VGMGWLLVREGNFPPGGIPLLDFFLIVLAIFRLIRLFSYDKITQFLRDFLYDFEELPAGRAIGAGGPGDRGEGVRVKQKPLRGIRRTILELLDCPWCTGVWIALFVVFFYFYTPYFWFPLLILAVSGVATFLQLTANMIGWTGERLKRETEQK
ncbi:MAG: DUF1360 domain-containing protein, partial [bacterium]|nr:DUF1360 domain-containing protein [bacterium]